MTRVQYPKCAHVHIVNLIRFTIVYTSEEKSLFIFNISLITTRIGIDSVIFFAKYLQENPENSTNFMTLIPTLTFTELCVVSIEHLQRVWRASRERLPFWTPGSAPPPHFGTCLCPNCWDQIPRTCRVFTGLFTSNILWYFLDFAH